MKKSLVLSMSACLFFVGFGGGCHKDEDEKSKEQKARIATLEAEVASKKAELEAKEIELAAESIKVPDFTSTVKIASLEAQIASLRISLSNTALETETLSSILADQVVHLMNLNISVGAFLNAADGVLADPAKITHNTLIDLGSKKDVVLKEITDLEIDLFRGILKVQESGKTIVKSLTGLPFTDVELAAKDLSNLRRMIQNFAQLLQKTVLLQNPKIDTSALNPVKKIKLTTEEQKLNQQAQGASGFARGANNSVSVFKSQEDLQAFARANGYSVEATSSAYQISSRSGGVVRFAKNSDASSILDILANIKNKLNATTEDLDLVFAIDYSGSMSDDISAVISGLDQIVVSLGEVKKTRNVRLGIALFGQEGKESIALDFTDNFITVRNKLKSLLDNYQQASHSDGPGEASFHGLNLIASKMVFKSKTPMIILITDEDSKEITLGQNSYVEGVWSRLKSKHIDTSIFTIVTSN